MKIDELQDGQKVVSRTGRSGRCGVDWEEDWTEHTLYVQRDRNGRVCVVTLRDKEWAEAGISDFCPDTTGEGGTFLVEDYYLQIKGLE